ATVSDNTSGTGSGFGGGIYNAGTATLNRVTVSGNAAGGGGGLGSDFDITLTNVTISGNTASSGAALMHNGGQATLVNVTLGNYGGPTLTQALLSGSPAIDAGGSDCPPPTTDQRGPGHCSGTPTTTCTGNTCPSGQACVGHCSTTLTTSCTASGNCPVGETCV